MIRITRAIGKMSLLTLGLVAVGCGADQQEEEVASALTLSGQMPAAFQSSDHFLKYDKGGNITNTGVSMKSGTVPSLTTSSNGLLMGVQNVNGNFLVAFENGSAIDSGGLMAAGTSPSVFGLFDGEFEFGFQGSNGHLWMGRGFTPINTGHDTGGLVRAGTSPSVTQLSDGNIAMALQGTDGMLWIGMRDMSSGKKSGAFMAGGTSPSIAPFPASTFPGALAYAFQGSNGDLFTGTATLPAGATNPTFTNTDTQGRMRAGTSPSIVVSPSGTVFVAFQNSAGALSWAVNGAVQATTFAMASNASPVASVTAAGDVQAAFKGQTGDLTIAIRLQGMHDEGIQAAMN